MLPSTYHIYLHAENGLQEISFWFALAFYCKRNLDFSLAAKYCELCMKMPYCIYTTQCMVQAEQCYK